MVLNYIVIAFLFGAIQLCMGDAGVFQRIVDATFSSSKTAFETSLGLTGVLALWLGIMKIGERSGMVDVLARCLSPLFTKLFPDIPRNHPAMGSIFMNIASNMLGLDNAATPIIITALWQRINLLQPVLLSFLGGIIVFLGLVIWVFGQMDKDTMATVTSVASNFILLSIILTFILSGVFRKVNVYDAFIEGAKEGFSTAVRIIPYLVAILVGVGVFRASGAMDMTALMKPLSGSGARGLMLEAMSNYGPDSFVGRLSCIFQGSTDTTFYILAVYFGAVSIKYTRHAVACGLLADLFGVAAAISVAYLFFG